MSFGVLAGIVLVVGLILGVGFLSGRRVKDSSDFLSSGGKAGKENTIIQYIFQPLKQQKQ